MALASSLPNKSTQSHRVSGQNRKSTCLARTRTLRVQCSKALAAKSLAQMKQLSLQEDAQFALVG